MDSIKGMVLSLLIFLPTEIGFLDLKPIHQLEKHDSWPRRLHAWITDPESCGSKKTT